MTTRSQAPMAEVEGKVAFVSGGSSGIGLGIAEAFAEAGMRVAIGYRSPAHLADAKQALDRFGDNIHAIEVDVVDRVGVERAAAETAERFGKIHAVVANAGVAAIMSIAEASYDDWDWQIGINLTGVFNTVRAFLPHIRAHTEGGQIIATSSVMGLFTARSHALYSASKFGVVGLMEGLRLELFGTGVGVSIFCPGNVAANLEARTPASPEGAPRTRTDTVAREEARRKWGDIVMDPIEAGRLVLEGMRRDDFYILTHPEFGWMIEERHRAIERAHPALLIAPPERVANVTKVYHSELYASSSGNGIA